MLNPGLPETLWSRLDRRLWHATERKSLSGIISDGEIRVGVGVRYRNSFCRCQDAVSLFDFGPTAVDDWGQFKNWDGWFGHQQESRTAIWLEIDRTKAIDHLLDARAAHKKSRETLHRQIIPGVEACHKGPIPLASVVSALLIARDKREVFQQCDVLNAEIFQQIEAFELKLPAPPQNELVEALLTGRQRCALGAAPDRTALVSVDLGKK